MSARDCSLALTLLLKYQFRLYNFLCLRFQRVHQPHPAHGVTGFQFLGDAWRLHHAGSMASIRSRVALVKADGDKCPHRLSFCRYAAVRLSGRVQQTRQLLQPAPDTLPHAAAASALDPGDLRHRHAQVEPGVDAPGLDGG